MQLRQPQQEWEVHRLEAETEIVTDERHQQMAETTTNILLHKKTKWWKYYVKMLWFKITE